MATHLKEPDHITNLDLDEAAPKARKFWREEREGWILDRALPVYLTYNEKVWWDPDDEGDREIYQELFQKVLDLPRERE